MSPVGFRLLRRVSFCTLHRSATCPNAGSGLGPPGKGQENHRKVSCFSSAPSLPFQSLKQHQHSPWDSLLEKMKTSPCSLGFYYSQLNEIPYWWMRKLRKSAKWRETAFLLGTWNDVPGLGWGPDLCPEPVTLLPGLSVKAGRLCSESSYPTPLCDVLDVCSALDCRSSV